MNYFKHDCEYVISFKDRKEQIFVARFNTTLVGAWNMDKSLSRGDCTNSVVSTKCKWYSGACGCVGTCARTEKHCASKIASYVCNQLPYQVPYICQKRKIGIFSISFNEICYHYYI